MVSYDDFLDGVDASQVNLPPRHVLSRSGRAESWRRVGTIAYSLLRCVFVSGNGGTRLFRGPAQRQVYRCLWK